MEFGLKGNSKEGYSVTELSTGMRAGSTYDKLNDFKKDIDKIYQLFTRPDNQYNVKGARERFNKAKNR